MNSQGVVWALRLDQFEYDIVHRPGRLMAHADALSRAPLDLDRAPLTRKEIEPLSPLVFLAVLSTLMPPKPSSATPIPPSSATLPGQLELSLAQALDDKLRPIIDFLGNGTPLPAKNSVLSDSIKKSYFLMDGVLYHRAHVGENRVCANRRAFSSHRKHHSSFSLYLFICPSWYLENLR